MELVKIYSEKVKDTLEREYENFVLKQNHPCVMAKTLFTMKNYELNAYKSIHNIECLKVLINDLDSFINKYNFESNEFKSFLAVFPNDEFDTELKFENALWNTLKKINELDTSEWDKSVSDDPENANFSFSIKGRAFYIVGLHPNSSRIARQSPYTTIVFNLHWQFEKLREMGVYKKVKERIRNRDKKLQGSINPILKDFGKDSEAKQYSGRYVQENWKCPFANKQI